METNTIVDIAAVKNDSLLLRKWGWSLFVIADSVIVGLAVKIQWIFWSRTRGEDWGFTFLLSLMNVVIAWIILYAVWRHNATIPIFFKILLIPGLIASFLLVAFIGATIFSI